MNLKISIRKLWALHRARWWQRPSTPWKWKYCLMTTSMFSIVWSETVFQRKAHCALTDLLWRRTPSQ